MELDYKKLYEELVQRARELHKGGNALTKKQMEVVCPELAESEDKRVNEEIRNFLIDMECKREWIAYLEKQKEQKPTIFIPKFRAGDKVISTKNPHLTYDILEVGLINELGNPEYLVEILKDEHSDTPSNIKCIECQKMDSWGELVEQKPAEWSEEDVECYNSISNCLQNQYVPDSKRIKCLYWFKSLRPQSHWKPSGEQMKALDKAVLHYRNDWTGAKVSEQEALTALYDDLKKL